MIDFIVGIIVGAFLIAAIIGVIYCFSDNDDDFADNLLIVLKITFILTMGCAVYFIVRTTVSII